MGGVSMVVDGSLSMRNSCRTRRSAVARRARWSVGADRTRGLAAVGGLCTVEIEDSSVTAASEAQLWARCGEKAQQTSRTQSSACCTCCGEQLRTSGLDSEALDLAACMLQCGHSIVAL